MAAAATWRHSRRPSRRPLVAVSWALCLLLAALALAPTETAAYSFSSTNVISADEMTMTTGADSESRSTTAAPIMIPSAVVTRPKTADEDVEAAEAALGSHSSAGSSAKSSTSPQSLTPTVTPVTVAPTPMPNTPVSTTKAPSPSSDSSSSAATFVKTKSPTSESSTSASSSDGFAVPESSVDAQDISGENEASTQRGGSSDSSLDKTVVIVIVGIVAAIGALALVVSRQIKNSFSDGDYSDNEL